MTTLDSLSCHIPGSAASLLNRSRHRAKTRRKRKPEPDVLPLPRSLFSEDEAMQLLEEISRGDRSVSRIRSRAWSSLFELLCTGRRRRFVNVFSYNGFLLLHVRRRHGSLSRFQRCTSLDRNHASAPLRSPLKPGTVFDVSSRHPSLPFPFSPTNLLSLLFLTVVPAFLAKLPLSLLPATAALRFEIPLLFEPAVFTMALGAQPRSTSHLSFSSRFFLPVCQAHAAYFSLYFTLFLVWLLVPFQQISSPFAPALDPLVRKCYFTPLWRSNFPSCKRSLFLLNLFWLHLHRAGI